MLGKIFGVTVLISLVAALLTGNGQALGGAVLDGVGSAVTLTLTLAGMMCFWSGIMAVLREAGAIRLLSRLMRPLIRVFFPDAYRTGEGVEEICANISANLLGLGNAATPMGLAAMRKLSAQAEKERRAGASGDTAPGSTAHGDPVPEGTATGDMITLAVLNTASVSLVPSTVIVLRQNTGSADPFRVVAAVWICSFCSALLALILTRLCRIVVPRKKRKHDSAHTLTKPPHSAPAQNGGTE